jgi:hypothetical protein
MRRVICGNKAIEVPFNQELGQTIINEIKRNINPIYLKGDKDNKRLNHFRSLIDEVKSLHC